MDAVLPAGPGAAFPRNSESTAAVKPISTAGPDGITHLLAKFSKQLDARTATRPAPATTYRWTREATATPA